MRLRRKKCGGSGVNLFSLCALLIMCIGVFWFVVCNIGFILFGAALMLLGVLLFRLFFH